MICGVESTLAAADDGELDFPAEQQAGEGEGNRGGGVQGQRELAQCALSYS